ncbi:MAG: GIY-YIG nuclease family protein [Patescibacteria group bacterium]
MPSNTSSAVFFYVYVLESLKDFKRYIGYTNNLKKRMEEHEKGMSFATKCRLPFRLTYYEACLNEADAKRREHYLKSTQGRRFLGLRLVEYKRQKQTAFGVSGS